MSKIRNRAYSQRIRAWKRVRGGFFSETVDVYSKPRYYVGDWGLMHYHARRYEDNEERTYVYLSRQACEEIERDAEKMLLEFAS